MSTKNSFQFKFKRPLKKEGHCWEWSVLWKIIIFRIGLWDQYLAESFNFQIPPLHLDSLREKAYKLLNYAVEKKAGEQKRDAT